MASDLSGTDKIGRLGKPSLCWGAGQQRRLEQVCKFVDLKGKRILDVGCGLGMYSRRFLEYSPLVCGADVDAENIAETCKFLPEAFVAPAEELPWKDESFDVVFMHEVLEHVNDDKKSVSEALRVLKPGGKLVIYVPNRLYPFETHGMYLGKKYVYKLIPFLNWLPMRMRNKLAPHVRIYTVSSLKKLWDPGAARVATVDFIFPALDKVSRRYTALAPVVMAVRNVLEKTPLRHFGISVFMVVEKI